MEIRQLDPTDEALVRRLWEVRRLADLDTRPLDLSTSWESTWAQLSRPRQDRDVVLLGALDPPTGAVGVSADHVVGVAVVRMGLLDNLHLADASYAVLPDHRRRGAGRALVETSYDVARSRGRRVLATETYAPLDETSPGVGFAEAMGFVTGLVDEMKVVDLPATEPSWDALEASVAERHPDYRLVTWQDRVPDELIEDYCAMNALFNAEAPMGDLDVELERWDEERVRDGEARAARSGQHDVSAAVLAPDGEMVALTEIGVDEHTSSHAQQSGTLVRPEHRGRALGLAVKLANHRQVRRSFPDLRLLVTGNADVNAAMNAVNHQLGYRSVERCLEMQRSL